MQNDTLIHRFVPGTTLDAPTLLLLHGTGGDENDLLTLGRTLSPGSSLLSPRGNVLENGTTPRFFRRLAEGVFDEVDLRARTHGLADFVGAAAGKYGFDPARVVAVGYSNGANIAAATLLLRPEVLRGAVLLRAMVPLAPAGLPDLRGKEILLCAGSHDPIVPEANVEQLAGMFRAAGAATVLRWTAAGYPLTAPEIEGARGWISERFRARVQAFPKPCSPSAI